MTANALAQFSLLMALVLGGAWPLGEHLARVYQGRRVWLDRALGPLERALYRLAGVRAGEEMTWRQYALAFLAFHLVGLLVVYATLRLQRWLPLNPERFAGMKPDLALNTAISFVTNTNWQSYGGETALSQFSQMAALTVQNFVSAAAGMAVAAALIRGLTRRSAATVGSFWRDLVRGTLYVLLPLSLILALALVSQGVVQTFAGAKTATLVESYVAADGTATTTQRIAVGPAASQIAIKQLGTNGGGFFNVNAAHPLENPTPLSDLLENVAILLLPAAFCFAFGAMVGDRRQGLALLAAMLAIFVPLTLGALAAEQSPNPALQQAGLDQAPSALQAGGNMEGKEARFGPVDSALWAAATAAASNGSVNAMHDSFNPLGGLVPLLLIQLGEIVFGGVGSGLYGMLMFAIVAVFVAGLMVGRTPEYLGKKIEPFEMKMASLVILLPAACVLIGTAAATVYPPARAAALNPGPHGFSEILYAFSSAANNNGSAFAGLATDAVFYNFALALAMFLGRFWLAIPVLAAAGSLARKQPAPPSAGTLPTHTPLFVVMLVAVILIVGALTFFPALALGPIVEQLLPAV